jgi:hypothetical protein
MTSRRFLTLTESLAAIEAAGGIAPTKASYRAHRIRIGVIRELARTRQIVAIEVEGRPRWAVRTQEARPDAA